jgi:hypothetical protein
VGVEDLRGRRQQLLFPAVILGGVNPLAPAQFRHLDVGLHARQDDAPLVGRAPLPPLAVVAHGWSSRFGYPILPSLEGAIPTLAPVPLLLKHYTPRERLHFDTFLNSLERIDRD